ncbi:MAG TPA: type II toxin-antitoxin system RelE/ParE family toxin [Asticcacaulis sp.]|nr:type II toxin-antitoxin system RelE/ParE family toxin [Asticcacaulis sp.]
MASRWYLTAEALANLRDIARRSVKIWGRDQAKIYHADLEAGFKIIAERHARLPRKPAGIGALRLHRIKHHYAVFWVLADDCVVITNVMHERMDVSTRLRVLQTKLESDVGEVRRTILKDNLSRKD